MQHKKNNLLIAIKLFLCINCLLLSLTARCEGSVLNVAVDNFSPPFVLRGANNQFYGFDIGVMDAICQLINRTCRYKPMPFSQLINAVADNNADAAIGAITITSERSQVINFSTPYMLSTSLFIGLTKKAINPFTISSLNNMKIGVQSGTIYPQVISSLGLADSNVTLYSQPEAMIEALQANDIDIVLMDAPAALYWQSQSSGELTTLGKPLSYGFGLGIAVNLNNPTLLEKINTAIITYQNSALFKDNYNRYLSSF